jgi:predicted transcriptional regulator
MVLQHPHKDRVMTSMVAEKEITLLCRHIDILRNVMDHGPIGIIRLSQLTGQPQHMIRYSLRTLENDGVIIPSAQGAVATDKVADLLDQLDETFDTMISRMTAMKKRLH